jgi:asparagine synthase (glutamine-hydrolysing)
LRWTPRRKARRLAFSGGEIVAGFAGILRLDGAPLDAASQILLDAMGAAMAHRGLAERRVVTSGPFGLVLPVGAKLAFDGRAPADLGEQARVHGAGVAERPPERIEGPFALAQWDEAAQRLSLSRDRLGARPLFFARTRELFLFGSELKSLLAHPDCPREVDWLAALARHALPLRSYRPSSFIIGIEPLAPGTTLTAEARGGTVDSRRWYAPSPPEASVLDADARSDAEIIAGYRGVLSQAVAEALGADGARAGLLLSGGIDSLSLAALAQHHGVALPTFTVLGQSTFGNGDAQLAHRAAARLGLPEHQVLFRVDEPIAPDDWRRILWLSESPSCAFQHYYKLHLHRFARQARPDLTVMLNGEGSDELSGADFRNHGDEREDGSFDDYLAQLGEKQREQWHSVESLGIEAWLGRCAFNRDFLARSSDREPPPHAWHRRAQYCLDAFSEDILWRDDRLAAGCGFAAMAPFLDARVVDFALAIPPRAFPRLFWKKHLLREAMAGLVPDELRHAPKIGFFSGVDARFSTRLLYNALMAEDRRLVREAFGDGAHPVLADGLVDDILEDLERDPQRGAVSVLLPLVNLGLLQNMARDAAARPGPALAIPALGAFGEWDEEKIAEQLAPARREVDLDAPLAFSPGVYLVRPDQVGAEPISYLVVNDEVRFVLDDDETKNWREVLRRIDGRRPLGQILDELGLSLAEIRKHLDEAWDFDVLAKAGTA